MPISKEDIENVLDDFLKDKSIKHPFAKDLGNGWYEVFDGKSTSYMGKRLYERFQKLMLEEGLKGLNNKKI